MSSASCCLTVCLILAAGDLLVAAEIDDCRDLFLHGEYDECLERTAAAIEKGVYGEAWHQLKAQAEFELGRYAEAMQTLRGALERYTWSVRLRWLALQCCRYVGESDQTVVYADEIAQLVKSTPWRYTDAENLVMLGRFALAHGADAKDVQETFFQRAKRNNPLHRAPVLALGKLALEKHDYQLAAEIYRPALEMHSEDPDILFGLSQAMASADSEQATQLLQQALEQNPNHVAALLSQVDQQIDGEQYDAALEFLKKIDAVNPHHPAAWAFRSVIHTLRTEVDDAEDARKKALSTWETNPEVDHIIGRELSQKYRFAEGEVHQWQAVVFDGDYLPAKKQLVQDMMRLGREEEGWELADEVHERDQYDVAIYNLVTLRDELEKFQTIEADGFAIRMDPFEAQTYGPRVLKLLTEARSELCAKYDHSLPETILVEIFPNPADFAVRTFGMPVAGGYLGVCFGDVITANSPASQDASPTNWQSVLWHEFAHVVTLNKTRNRMPRWLSEGISVYEERLHDRSWGERMTPTYRQMILDGKLTPIGELSQAFLSPETPVHLQFAYYQSSLVVEYLVDEFGFEALIAILDDLSFGMFINEAIERHTAPLAQLDEEFVRRTRQLAEEFGAEVDWSSPDLASLVESDLAVTLLIAWAASNERNYNGLKACAELLLRLEAGDAARDVLEQAVELFPYETGLDSPRYKLAELYRTAGEPAREYEILRRLAEIDDDAAPAFVRLIELERERQNWGGVRTFGLKLMAVKPIIATPHDALADAAEQIHDASEAVAALESLITLDDSDPALLHYRLARNHRALGDRRQARRHVLQSLEEAPRYRDALALLLSLHSAAVPPPPPLAEEIPAGNSQSPGF